MLDSIVYLRVKKSMVAGVNAQSKKLNVTNSEYMRMAIQYYLQTGAAIRLKAEGRAGLLHCDTC